MKITDVTVFYEKEYALINYSETGHYVIITWSTSPSSGEYRESMEALIAAMKQFKAGRLIVDNRKAGALHPDDQEWTVSDWHVRALAAGHTHAAIVQSSDIFAHISAIDVMSQVTIPTAFFNEVEGAVKWMAEVR
jgi:hypothetical protein